MKKMLGLMGCLVVLAVLATPALADSLGDKIATWCSKASPGDTLTLTSAESTTYDQHTSRGYVFSPSTRFEFENGQGVCTLTYTSMGGEQVLSAEMSVIHKNGNTLTMGNRTEK